MGVTQLIDRFLEFEDRNDLFEHEILGFKFWHFARFEFYRDVLLKQLADVGQPHDKILSPEATTLEKVQARLKKLRWYGSHHLGNRSLGHLSNKDIIVTSHPRRFKEEGFYTCPYTDTFLSRLESSYYVFEEPYYLGHSSPVRTENLKYLDSAILRASMKRKLLGSLNRGTSGSEAAMFKDLAKKLNVEFGVSFDAEKFQQAMLNLTWQCICLKKELGKLIDAVSPKLIIEVISYTMVNMLLTSLAKKRGIKTVELQHGTMTQHHVAYNFHRKRVLETFPDYLFAFGNNWKRSTRLPLDEDRVIVTGFPYIEKKAEQYAGGYEAPCQKNTILFISEGLVGKALSRLACELAGMVDMDRYRIIYKLHPGEYLHWRKRYPWLIDSQIEVADSYENSIYHYFAISQYVVGVSSTAIFETLPFSLKIFIYAVTNHEYAQDLYMRGYAELISSARDISRALNSHTPDTSCIVSDFWEPNATRNVVEKIQGVLSGSLAKNLSAAPETLAPSGRIPPQTPREEKMESKQL
ncbi:MAG: hypothetical protein ABIH66_09975 [bacterium]